tara:strand:- start:742 stop:1377 length:636 start_codon:yes stop_codon:yes gene_type:complete
MGLISLLNSDPSSFVFLSICLVFSLCFHEFSHSLAALLLGDDTSYRLKRTNINPLNHLDPMGTMMILFVGFGWAKPVPVNPYNLENPTKDMMKIAFAGPASNLLLAFIALLISNIFSINTIVVSYFYIINLALAVFNLLPISPLDGSQIFNPIIYRYNRRAGNFLTKYGSQILLSLILFGLFTGYSLLWQIMSPIISLINTLFITVVNFIS